jgi:molybdopterin-guanine dinucleotide biosynthesis protein A
MENIMNQWKTAVLLTDFPGQAKGVPFLEIHGETLLERTYYKAREFFDKIFIVSNSLREKSDIERKVSDADVVLNLKNKGLIPKYANGNTEMLHAVYRTRPTIAALQNALFDEQKDFLQNLSLVTYLPVGELTDFDKKLETFFNLKSESELSIVKSRFNKKVYKNRLKKADTLYKDIVKEKETAVTAYYCVPGTEEEHSVTFNKRKESWGCDCKYYTMKACYCSHILAAQKHREGEKNA